MYLTYPATQYLPSYIEAGAEYRAAGVDTYHFLDPAEQDVLGWIHMLQTGEGLADMGFAGKYVRSTYLWLVDGETFVGELAVRHSLTPSLRKRGGHIGYGVRLGYWGGGIGTRLLGMGLDWIRVNLPALDKTLVTCRDDNCGSARVIEKNGGVLEDIIEYEGQRTRRYWIQVRSKK